MDIKQLTTFVTLAKEKNYIKTSEVLNYAPSTLAKHVHGLEDEFNVTLVQFLNGQIELTENGIKFLKYAKTMLKVYQNCEEEFKGNRNHNVVRVAGGELMVGFSFGDYFLNDQKDETTNQIEVNTVCCAKVPGWLEKDECDIGFVQMVDMAENGGAGVIPLFQEKLCVMASPAHPLTKYDAVCTADFEGFSFTYTYADCCFTEKFRKDLKQSSIRLSSELLLGSIQAVIESCLKDSRLCLIPYVDIEQVKKMGLVPLNWVDSFNIYDCILYKEEKLLEPNIKRIVDGAKKYAKELRKNPSCNDIVIL